MKTITHQVYSFNELDEDAQANAIEAMREDKRTDEFLTEHDSNEILKSIEAIAEALGADLRDYTFGSYCQHYKLKIILPGYPDWMVSPSGNKILAEFTRFLVNNGYPRAKTFAEQEFPGICGFTGVWSDEFLVEAIHGALRRGDSWNAACNAAAYEACRVLEKQWDYLTSEEAVRETLDKDEEQFNKDGSLYG